ncbi:hypothetical protein IP69_18185 [Bosea sp. AAP35]|nr:hypothetical protein IP69_18185 [Bosea sp. AAP35]
MPAGRGDLEHALGAFLALDVGEIGQRAGWARDRGLRPRHHLRALEMVGELDQRTRREDVDIGRGPGGLRARRVRADQALPPAIGGDCRRQHASHRRDRAIEREFAEHRVARQRVGRNRADRRHYGERDRQVVMAALLGQIGWGEVDGDALGRQRQARGDQRGADALLALAHRLVGQPDQNERDAAGRNLDLDIDGARLDALERHRCDPRHHPRPPCTKGG